MTRTLGDTRPRGWWGVLHGATGPLRPCGGSDSDEMIQPCRPCQVTLIPAYGSTRRDARHPLPPDAGRGPRCTRPPASRARAGSCRARERRARAASASGERLGPGRPARTRRAVPSRPAATRGQGPERPRAGAGSSMDSDGGPSPLLQRQVRQGSSKTPSSPPPPARPTAMVCRQ